MRAQLDKALAKFPWFAPDTVQVFGGKFDPATLPRPYKLLPAMNRLPTSDLRDWGAIANWSKELAAKFRLGQDSSAD